MSNLDSVACLTGHVRSGLFQQAISARRLSFQIRDFGRESVECLKSILKQNSRRSRVPEEEGFSNLRVT